MLHRLEVFWSGTQLHKNFVLPYVGARLRTSGSSVSSYRCFLPGSLQSPVQAPSSVWCHCSWPHASWGAITSDGPVTVGAEEGLGQTHPKSVSVGKAAPAANLEVKSRRGLKPCWL